MLLRYKSPGQGTGGGAMTKFDGFLSEEKDSKLIPSKDLQKKSGKGGFTTYSRSKDVRLATYSLSIPPR
jgi:hypothetical protein